MHTYETLLSDLPALGLIGGDTLLVHSSMKAIGPVKGRADTVLDALMDYFAEDGLLVFPTLTWRNVNAEQPIFSVLQTPCVVGILPELFRQRPGVRRSLHPTHSLAAFGKEAAQFVQGHENFSTPCARQSPWGRLYDRKGKILFIGASIGSNTILHGVEEWAGAGELFSKMPQQLIVMDENNRHIHVPSFRHIGGHSQFYSRMEPRFKAAGALHRGRFGDAEAILLEVRKVADVASELLQLYPNAFTSSWNEKNPDFWNEAGQNASY